MLKSSYEIASVLARAFERYTNQVQNGDIQPYLALLNQDKIDVVFTVTAEGGLSVAMPKVEKAILESLPEAEAPIVEPSTEHMSEEELMETIKGNPIFPETDEEKPKRSRKKKEPEEVVPSE
jgi:molecular chaperone DnaK (HSP70)